MSKEDYPWQEQMLLEGAKRLRDTYIHNDQRARRIARIRYLALISLAIPDHEVTRYITDENGQSRIQSQSDPDIALRRRVVAEAVYGEVSGGGLPFQVDADCWQNLNAVIGKLIRINPNTDSSNDQALSRAILEDDGVTYT